MPIDASIYNLANKPTTPWRDPFEQAMNMQTAMAQQQHMMLQNKKLESDLQQTQAVQDAMKGVSDPQELVKKLQGVGNPYAIQMASHISDSLHKGVTVEKDKLELSQKKLGQFGSTLLSMSNTPGMDPLQVRDYVLNSGLLDPQGLKDTLSTLPTDPADLPAWGKLQAMKTVNAKEAIGMLAPQTTLGKAKEELAKGILTEEEYKDLKAKETRTVEIPRGNIAQDLEVYNQDRDSKDLPRVGGTDPGFLAWRNKAVAGPAAVRISLTEGRKDAKETARSEDSMRKEFNALPEVKNYKLLTTQFNQMSSVLNSLGNKKFDSLNPADQVLIMTFNKTLDPTSVVRESEYSRTPANMSLLNRAYAITSRLISGGVMSPDERNALVETAKVMKKVASEQYLKTRAEYERIASERNLKPENVVPNLERTGDEPVKNVVSWSEIKEAIKPGGKYAGKTMDQVVTALKKRGIEVK